MEIGFSIAEARLVNHMARRAREDAAMLGAKATPPLDGIVAKCERALDDVVRKGMERRGKREI